MYGHMYASRHVALLLDSKNEDGVVPAGFDVRHRREHRDAAGRARRLVPGGGQPPQCGLHRGRHRAELTLTGEQLPEGVPDVDGLDLRDIDLAVLQRSRHNLGDKVGDFETFAGIVAGEVGLITANDPHVCVETHHCLLARKHPRLMSYLH
jgi:hypothetical protein